MLSSTFGRFHVFVQIVVIAIGVGQVQAYDNTLTNNLAVYWGQNQGLGQQALSTYCADANINAIHIAFANKFFATGGLPALDVSNICSISGNGAYPGTELPQCAFLGDQINTCQTSGKIITISLGGGNGAVGFDSVDQAQTFADNIWNNFLGGTSSTRPFGTAVLDGINLDIEGGTADHYADFVTKLRTYTDPAPKKYYMTASPQCAFPDQHIGDALNAVAFDAIYVQCEPSRLYRQ
ncbi:hypothetical protein H0H93_010853 [Arthromyces matolae]|nr:hypothetical protein H0H93_010853 [Arthromyces matolae]